MYSGTMDRKFNIGILAHADAGKTTITEQLLSLSGRIRKTGSVDHGTTVTDFMEVEKRRGISVNSACVSLTYNGAEIDIIDTPGHVDFAGEVDRSLSAMDGAVLVLSGVEGVQAQTRTIYRALRELEIPTILVCNKIDRVGFERAKFEQQLKTELTERFAPVDSPEDVLAVLAEEDPEMEEAFLMEEMPDSAVLTGKLAEAAAAGKAFPLFYASAREGIGVQEILDGIVTYLPDAAKTEVPELSGCVFKLQYDDVMGRVAFVRLYGGRLKARDIAPVYQKEQDTWEKITQIRRVQGGRFEDVGEMYAGEIAAVYGLSDVRIGDWIGTPVERRKAGALRVRPLLLTEAVSENPEEREKLASALTILSSEDPYLEYERNSETGQMFLHIMGEIQTEVLTEILSTRFGVGARFLKPRVIYKETAGGIGEGFEAYTMPKPCWAIVTLRVEPLPAGSGIVFESVVKEGELALRYQNHVEASVYKTLKQGLCGWEVIDVKVTLMAGNSHIWHTHPLDFFVATPIALLRALQDSGSQLLEPWMKVHMEGAEDLLGKVMGQVIGMRGSFDTPLTTGGRFIMDAMMPLSECLDYPMTFRSLTSGKGLIETELSEYRPVPAGVMETRPRNGVDPLDRAKWILACRSALSKDLTGR